jgi:hypothetical protein
MSHNSRESKTAALKKQLFEVISPHTASVPVISAASPTADVEAYTSCRHLTTPSSWKSPRPTAETSTYLKTMDLPLVRKFPAARLLLRYYGAARREGNSPARDENHRSGRREGEFSAREPQHHQEVASGPGQG